MGTGCKAKVNVITGQTPKLFSHKLTWLHHPKSVKAGMRWRVGADLWTGCCINLIGSIGCWLVATGVSTRHQQVWATVRNSDIKVLPTCRCYAVCVSANCLPCDSRLNYDDTSKHWLLSLMDSALTHNGYLSRMCHQVYEQQIANLKNDMSLAIQINPINYTSAYCLKRWWGLMQD